MAIMPTAPDGSIAAAQMPSSSRSARYGGQPHATSYPLSITSTSTYGTIPWECKLKSAPTTAVETPSSTSPAPPPVPDGTIQLGRYEKILTSSRGDRLGPLRVAEYLPAPPNFDGKLTLATSRRMPSEEPGQGSAATRLQLLYGRLATPSDRRTSGYPSTFASGRARRVRILRGRASARRHVSCVVVEWPTSPQPGLPSTPRCAARFGPPSSVLQEFGAPRFTATTSWHLGTHGQTTPTWT